LAKFCAYELFYYTTFVQTTEEQGPNFNMDIPHSLKIR